MSYAGIDYASGTGSNQDSKTGIRYGVISQNSISGDALNDMEPYYGEPHCPVCGNDATFVDSLSTTEAIEQWENYSKRGCDDYACLTCEHFLDSSEVFSDEALGFSYEQDGYKLSNCLDWDIFVLCSPYYTYAQFCSPCVPGAGNLDNPLTEEDGAPKTYALGLDWFDEYNPCPYKDNLYLVATGERVMPESE